MKENSKIIEFNNSKKENSDENVVKKTARDVSADLVRLVACLIVILTHVSLQIYNTHIPGVDWSRLFEKCFFTDGVPLFFMLTGFFIVNGRSYKKIWKSTIFKVLIPTIIYILFAQVFVMYILGKESLSWCLTYAIGNLNLLGILRSFLTGDLIWINSLCEHLWYILSYIKIVIWIPVLWLICKEDKNAKFARRLILGFSFLALIIMDVQKFWTIPWIGEITYFALVDKEIMYVLLGYELFTYKDKIKSNKYLKYIALASFVLVNAIRYKIEMQYMIINCLTDISNRVSFMEWKYTFLNVISSVALFIFLYSFEIKNNKLQKVICYLANYTFGIYLIHYAIIAKIDLFKFEIFGKVWQEIIYLFLAMISIFIISFILIFIYRQIKKLVKFLLSKIFAKNRAND